MLQVSNISKRYGDVQVLKAVSFVVNPGERLALIGPNGCGKTTLLRIVMGEVSPDIGSVRVSPSSIRLGYLEQGMAFDDTDTLNTILRANQVRMAELEADIAALAVAMTEAEGEAQAQLLDAYAEALETLETLAQHQVPAFSIEAILDGLGLGALSLDTPVAHLSGGQKTRLGLARLLIQDPQILLLDEPTNHLDIAALEWLETWLQQYEGGVIIVSHDRTFLDRTVTTILELDPATHTVTTYAGNYSAYLDVKRQEMEKQLFAYREQQERIARLQGESRRLTGYANSIEHGTIDFAPRKIAKGIARRAVVQRRRIERELDEDRLEKPKMSWHMKLDFVDTPPSGQDVLVMKDLAVGYDGTPLLQGVTQLLRYGERVALLGANGSGKTTLLRTVVGTLSPLQGELRLGANVKLGYYAQEQETLDPARTPFDLIREISTMSDTDVRSFLHYFLFAGDDVFVPVGTLSYGERARLVLARLVATGCNCLLLDEPINHLDIPSRSSFEQAMTAFEGTVLAVVHDRYFIEQFATRVWAVEDGTVHNYVDLGDYQRIQRKVGA